MPNVERAVLLVLALVAVGLSVRSADADQCDNASFGTVTLTQNGANVDVVVAPSSSFQFVKTGAVDFEYFVFNVSGAFGGSISVDQNVFGKTLAAQPGSFTVAGAGDFGYGITCPTCRNGRSGALPVNTQLVFHVIGATLAQLEVANAFGNIFVADLQCVSSGKGGAVEFTAP
jgi:hypothetical protein